MIKLQLEGIVREIGRVEPTGRNRRYFRQAVILHQPQEEYKGIRTPEEHYVITILSTSETDSRFLKHDMKDTFRKCSVYLKGERWASGHRGEYNYNHKLNLVEWQH